MDNQQLCNLFTNNQIQVLLSGRLGDGCFNTDARVYNPLLAVSSIHKEYMEFKKTLLGNLATGGINSTLNKGFKEGIIYSVRTNTREEFNYIKEAKIESLLPLLDELGLAIWFYDDGSLHREKSYYNLYTNSFDLQTHETVFIPLLLNRFNIKAKVRIDRKKDGRIFYYLSVGKYDGSFIVNEILSKYKIDCFKYKLWSSETIQIWSKFQEELKSEDIRTITTGRLSHMWRRAENSYKVSNIRYSPNL